MTEYKKRELGYYWVLDSDTWVIAQYMAGVGAGYGWRVMWCNHIFEDEDWTEIDETRIEDQSVTAIGIKRIGILPQADHVARSDDRGVDDGWIPPVIDNPRAGYDHIQNVFDMDAAISRSGDQDVIA